MHFKGRLGDDEFSVAPNFSNLFHSLPSEVKGLLNVQRELTRIPLPMVVEAAIQNVGNAPIFLRANDSTAGLDDILRGLPTVPAFDMLLSMFS